MLGWETLVLAIRGDVTLLGSTDVSVVADREHLRYLQQDSTDLVQERFDVV